MQFNKPSNFGLLGPTLVTGSLLEAHTPCLPLLAMLAFYAYTAKIKEK